MASVLVKSTLNIKEENKLALELLVKNHELSSFTEGVNIAIEKYIQEKRREAYAKEMKKAALDEDFMKRTMGVNTDFTYADREMDEQATEDTVEW